MPTAKKPAAGAPGRRAPAPSASRAVAGFLVAGGAFLAYRAATLIAEGQTAEYATWLAGLTYAELALAVAASLAALAWLVRGAPWTRLALRLTAALVVLHAVRVGVFVLARTGPVHDFDLQPEFRPLAADAWSSTDVWVAGGLAALSVVVLVVVWRGRRRVRRRPSVRP